MVKTWNLSANSIDVIYNGSNALYKPVAPEVAEQARKEFTQGKPYFIYVGSLNPRKNIEGMMQSFDAFKQQSGLTHQLVIVGEKMWGNSEIENVYENMLHKNDVLFTGRLSDEKLHILLASAHALVLVSHLEGFGIPLLEAMCCDVPVLCSNVTALPEVAGNAGHLVNPNSVDSIAQGFAKLAGDENYRQSLISNARIQRVKFNWDQSAERLWNGIEKCF